MYIYDHPMCCGGSFTDFPFCTSRETQGYGKVMLIFGMKKREVEVYE